ncbi:hypothetical protein BV25DRAFT_1809822 [Artomyces pyxidatus]|uniref:Uncharacterized protein n=1 Tax=Artomyces pyxidatus TaxID=48021 RepID=A0ACB8SS21_9AGAM|nr:hypothetical protein BV25DRAFT_1809822 [Artomyces pyxidatus]
MDIQQSPCGVDDLSTSLPAIGENSASVNLSASSSARRSRKEDTKRLNLAWVNVLSSLVLPLLEYVNSSVGHPVPSKVQEWISSCQEGCSSRIHHITCLNWDSKNGFFPTSPSDPGTAVSVPLLDFYFALFERSGDAVTAFSAALRSVYTKRGYPVVNQAGIPIEDPFRRGLSNAIQWYDQICIRIERSIQASVDKAIRQIDDSRKVDVPSEDGSITDLTAGVEAHKILQRRCPACFAGKTYGVSFDRGGDVHVAVDANFHHRHRKSVGDNGFGDFFDPEYIIPKEEVDAVGEDILRLRPRPSPKRNIAVPQEAIDECEKSYQAADGNKAKANSDIFDDTGLCSINCRHDIPLFVANLDTPGEQQKYAFSLIKKLFSLLPSNATVVVLYDIGCVVDSSLNKYEILPDAIADRLTFATSAMHAYGHQWSCQLVYNPRLKTGLGLTDGEGVERLWSRLRKLIPLERSATRGKRLWLIDHQLKAVHLELRDHLGSWISNRVKNGVEHQAAEASKTLAEIGETEETLRSEWSSQRLAQLSIRAHAPTRLKRELDTVLCLQADLDRVDEALAVVKAALSSSPSLDTPETKTALTQAEHNRCKMVESVEQMYKSLNVPGRFPPLAGVSLDFIHTLLAARDLKINIQKRAVASFLEWDRLDQAVGGLAQPLGTRLHQQTRKAISKRKPALLSSIRKFNKYCQVLKDMAGDSCGIPIPRPLSTQLEVLREDSYLLEELWITPIVDSCPRWLEDKNIRKGIRAMLKIDRTKEETTRLTREASNLFRWFGRELAGIEVAASDPSSENVPRADSHLLLAQKWSSSSMPSLTFLEKISQASHFSQMIHGNTITSFPHTPTEIPLLGFDQEDEGDEEDQRPFLDADQLVQADLLEQEVEEVDVPSESSADLQPLGNDALGLRSGCVPLAFHTATPPFSYLPRLISLKKDDIKRLHSNTQWINSEVLNSCALLLYEVCDRPSREDCAIFNSYDFNLIKHNTVESDYWRRVKRTEFWQRRTWLIPIHHEDHWLLCTVRLDKRSILYFDSFGAPGLAPWEDICELVLRFVLSLSEVAKLHNHPMDLDMSRWEAWHAHIEALQHNSHDCGVWVLAAMFARLRGYDTVNLPEENIKGFRAFLLSLVHRLPLYE